ncbi:LAMI_0G13696g1_1 [Lachancea mirantina]|uniref:LAMI_0G13696g1_1 n=1 Tax=Lachancea mirantina TaxID=1230905 RepID=A0A1G4KBU8_9SACH|nr:LAMI_0G13696g1_1 [Lachancea mirantina]
MVKESKADGSHDYKRCKELGQFDAGDKEIWLIKAPKNVKIGKLKSLPVDFAGSGHAIFELGDKRFEVKQEIDGDFSDLALLVPKNAESLVKGSDVSRVFSINESVELRASPKVKRSAEEHTQGDNDVALNTDKPAKKHKKDKKKDKKHDKKDKKEKKHKHKSKE